MKDPRITPEVLRPYCLAKAPIVSEGRIIRDLTMPPIDVAAYESPAAQRRTSRIIRRIPERITIKQAE